MAEICVQENQRDSMTAEEIIEYMESLRNEKQREVLMRFFKTAKGEYGYGDEFLGLKVPQTRAIVKLVSDLPLQEIPKLLMSSWHEVRLCGLLILVAQFEKWSKPRLTDNLDAIQHRDEIVNLYVQYAERANNWDLVDLSVHKIIGSWLLLPTMLGSTNDKPAMNEMYKLRLLDKFAISKCLWKQRMSIVCTWRTTQRGKPEYCLRYAEKLLHHPHDLIHKAVGWMLRELDKRGFGMEMRKFLEQHYATMPRTALRYAIELMPQKERLTWLHKGVK